MQTRITNILLTIIIIILLLPGFLIGLAYTKVQDGMGRGFDRMSSRYVYATARLISSQRPSIRALAEMADSYCKSVFRGHCDTQFDSQTDMYYVNVWLDGWDSATIQRVKSGKNKSDLRAWSETRHQLSTEAENVQESFMRYSDDDVTVVMNLCDPESHDKIYLTIANGIAGYDAVKNIDIR